jgi:hypothetical protein
VFSLETNANERVSNPQNRYPNEIKYFRLPNLSDTIPAINVVKVATIPLSCTMSVTEDVLFEIVL